MQEDGQPVGTSVASFEGMAGNDDPSAGAPSAVRLARVLAVVFGCPAALTVLLVVALLVSIGLLGRLASSAGVHAERVRIAEELKYGLLRHHRLQSLFLVDDGTLYETEATAEEARLRGLLAEAERGARDAREAALVDEIERRVEGYLETRRALQARELPFDQVLTRIAPEIDEAIASIERLAALQIAASRDEAADAMSWVRVATVVAVVALFVVILGLAAAWWSLRRQVWGPLSTLHAALERLGRGDLSARAPETGPRELQEIARATNVATERLARQREDQLEFLGGVAHDLRGPLTTLQLAFETVADPELTDPTERRRALEAFARHMSLLQRMVRDFLDSARVEAGQLGLRTRREPLAPLVTSAVDTHRLVTDTHRFHLRLPDAPVAVECDVDRIEQVLHNLLSNAVKYSPEGGDIDVRLTTGGDEAVIEVTDRGVGIPAKELPRVFEPFRRTGASKGLVPGVGLGLSVARRIVEAHGGRIEVDSTVGEGSTFRVRLPLGGPATPPETGESRTSPVGSPGTAPA